MSRAGPGVQGRAFAARDAAPIKRRRDRCASDLASEGWGQAMGHDVFLSYSSLDKLAADALAAGYANVIWYRGGINAWTAAGLPASQPGAGPANGG